MAPPTARAALVCTLAIGCTGETPQQGEAVPVVDDPTAEAGVFATADRWRFAGGLVVSEVRIEPEPAVPGEALTVSMNLAGVRGEVVARLSVVPPLPGSRQVALGGVDAPPPVLPPDPRGATVEATVVDGAWSTSLPLSQPWHPRTAMVTLELVGAGRRIEVTDGPRTDGGVAIVGLVPVQMEPTHVTAVRAEGVAIDGALDEAPWRGEGTTLVESLEGEPWSGRAGRVWFAWDDAQLYAAAEIPDRDIWATMTEQDDPLWKEEVFELFVFGVPRAQRYLELQVSPRGVTFDAKFATYRKGDEAWDSAWQTAVALDGTLDDRKDRDRQWTVEVAVPWSEICEHTQVPCPPQPGAQLRVNTFRFERPAKGATVGLALSPTRRPDFHASDNAAILELSP